MSSRKQDLQRILARATDLEMRFGSEDEYYDDDGAYREPIGYIMWSAQIVRPGDNHYSQIWSAKQYEITARDRFMHEREAFAQARAANERQHGSSYRVVVATHYWSRTPPLREIRWYPKEANPKYWAKPKGNLLDAAATATQAHLRQQASNPA